MRRIIAFAFLLVAIICASVATASPFSFRHGRGGYPPAVVAGGLQAVWDLARTGTGPRIGLTPVASYSPPGGVTYDGTNKGLTVASTNTVSAVDFTGNGLYVTTNGTTATIADVLLSANPACCYSAALGQTIAGLTGGAPTTNISYCTADFTGASAGHSPAILAQGGVTSFDHCTFKKAPRDPFVTGATLNVSWSYFAMFGQATDQFDHLEFIHWLGSGGGLISYSMFNALDSKAGGADGGVSGYFQIQSDNAAITSLTFDRIILYGSKLAGSHNTDGSPSVGLTPFSCKAVNFDVTIHVGHSVIQADPAGHYTVKTNLNGHTCTFVDDGGNLDFDTGGALVISANDNLPQVPGGRQLDLAA